MSRGVVYLSAGNSHACRLAVSLFTLRQHYQGNVWIMVSTRDDSRSPAVRLAKDPLVRAKFLWYDLPAGRNACYVAKSDLHRKVPVDDAVFLDADTLVTGPIDEVFPTRDEVVLTCFSNWVTTGRTMRKRLERWRHIAPDLVERSLDRDMPAINTGVLGWRRGNDLLYRWSDLTESNPIFMCDEIAMQLLLPGSGCRLLNDKFNRSPVYGKCLPEDAHVWHAHGDKHLHPGMMELWSDYLHECLRVNLGGIREWVGTTPEVKVAQ